MINDFVVGVQHKQVCLSHVVPQTNLTAPAGSPACIGAAGHPQHPSPWRSAPRCDPVAWCRTAQWVLTSADPAASLKCQVCWSRIPILLMNSLNYSHYPSLHMNVGENDKPISNVYGPAKQIQ